MLASYVRLAVEIKAIIGVYINTSLLFLDHNGGHGKR
jgi:hypothetical protein